MRRILGSYANYDDMIVEDLKRKHLEGRTWTYPVAKRLPYTVGDRLRTLDIDDSTRTMIRILRHANDNEPTTGIGNSTCSLLQFGFAGLLLIFEFV